jgi:Histone H1-like protein Hc1
MSKNHELVARIRSLKVDIEQAALEIDKATTGEGNKAAARRARKLLMNVSHIAREYREEALPFTKGEVEEPEPAILPTTPPVSPEVVD